MHDDCLKCPFWCCGVKFVKWGLSLFLLGFLVGFGVLIHYLVGSTWNNTSQFLGNITLWFGSPLSLSATYLQIGGLAMATLGAAKLVLSLYWKSAHTDTQCATYPHTHHHHGHGALILCNVGLIALFITGYIGYFIIDAVWPAFYYTPIVAGKNLWLSLQGISLLFFFIGLLSGFCSLCCHCKHRCKIK